MKTMKIMILPAFLVAVYAVQLAAQTLSDSIFYQQYRHYIVHLPQGYNPAQSHPVVFALHGGGGNAQGMMDMTGFNAVSDTAQFIVVYPEGIEDPNLAGSCSWAQGQVGTNGKPDFRDTMGIDDIGFLSRLIDTIRQKYSTDTTRVYFTGASQGGFMTQRMGCQVSDKVTAIAPVIATMYPTHAAQCAPTRSVPVLIMNGDADPIVPYNGGRLSGVVALAGADWSILSTDSVVDIWKYYNVCSGTATYYKYPNFNVMDNSTVERYHYGSCNSNSEVVLYKIAGGGHTWPGASVNWLYQLFAGYTNQDINASSVIWEFFRNHKLPTLTGLGEAETADRMGIYPNPVVSEMTIECQKPGVPCQLSEVRIFNVNGQLVRSKTGLSSSSIVLQRGNLPAGLYVAELSDNRHHVYRKKIILK